MKLKPNRFLVVKFGSLGDIVHCLPSVAQLRKVFPEAEIDWLIERKNKVIVELSGISGETVPASVAQRKLQSSYGPSAPMAMIARSIFRVS